MAEDQKPSFPYEIPWLRCFPWLRIFHAPGSATDPKRIVLATLGLVLTFAGWEGLDLMFPASAGVTPEVIEASGMSEPETLLEVAWWLTEPPRLITAPFFEVLSPTTPGDVSSTVHATLAALWTLLVWGPIGGAICRVSAISLVFRERLGLLDALRFAKDKWVPLVGTPFIPLLGMGLVGLLLGCLGLLYRVPGGPTVAGILGFLPLAGGVLLTLVLLGLAAGWPLMMASVATQAEDGFDAMSRSYAYVRQRPWHYLAYAAIAFATGMVGLVFVLVFADLVVHLAGWGLSLGGPAALVTALYDGEEADVARSALIAHGFWLNLVTLLVRGWIFSVFWTAATIIYLLLRLDVDGTPWTKIAYQTRLLRQAEREASSLAEPTPTPAPPASSPAPGPHPTGIHAPDEVTGA